jgi:transposase
MKAYCGVDVGKKELVLSCKLLKKRQAVIANESRAIKQLIKQFLSDSNNPELSFHVVLEASGGYEAPLVRALSQAGIAFSIVLPNKVRSFARALGILAKTDRIDAEVIRLFGERTEPKASTPKDCQQVTMHELLKRRDDLTGMLVSEKNRLEQVNCSGACKSVTKSINALIKILKAQIASLDREIKVCATSNKELQNKIEIVTSFCGVGALTAQRLVTFLSELGFASRQQIAALVGVAPINRESGSSLRGVRSIGGGRAELRNYLYMATLSAIRSNNQIKVFYKRLREKGKPAKVAIIAALRKMLVILNAMVKSNSRWRGALNS